MWEDNRTKTRWQGIVFLSDAPDVTRGMQVSDALSVLAWRGGEAKAGKIPLGSAGVPRRPTHNSKGGLGVQGLKRLPLLLSLLLAGDLAKGE